MHKPWCPSSQSCNCGAREEEWVGVPVTVSDETLPAMLEAAMHFPKLGEAPKDIQRHIEVARQQGREEERERYAGIFSWLLGLAPEGFPERQEGEGAYYWRSHLRQKLEKLDNA